MSPINVYAYYDGSGRRYYADQNDVAFVGTWSATGTYLSSLLQVVDYTNGQYIAITDSINKNPQTPPSRYDPTRYWSPFVIVIEGTGTGSGITPEDAYDLAQDAYELAVAGTLIGSQAYALAETALELARAGTLSHGYVNWAGTMELDMTGDDFQSVNVNGDTRLLLLNYEAPVPLAKSVTARLINSTGSEVSLFFDPEIVWFGQGAPNNIPSDLSVMVNFTSLGTALSDVCAAFTQSI